MEQFAHLSDVDRPITFLFVAVTIGLSPIDYLPENFLERGAALESRLMKEFCEASMRGQ